MGGDWITMQTKFWNRCDGCGKFIPFKDFESGEATREFVTPDSMFTTEEYENFCRVCSKLTETLR